MSLPNKAWFAIVLVLATASVASARNAIIDSNLNLRAGPGPAHRVVTVIPAGSSVAVGECDGEWCTISYRGQRGYVSSALIKGGDGAYAGPRRLRRRPPPPSTTLTTRRAC